MGVEKKLLVYVGIPFCTSKCHFCDWVREIPTSTLRQLDPSGERRRYIEALTTQIRTQGARLAAEGHVPSILYWGGGTPSILTADEVHTVMDALRDVFDLGGLVESTIECSPDTLSLDKLRAFRGAGFQRISIGLQSMNDERLRRIGRAHDAAIGTASVRWAKEAGFDNINVDLISGFPGETLAEFEASIRAALELPINHVSLYPYRPANGTVMHEQLRKGLLGNVELAEQLGAYRLGQTLLAEAGMPEYALSYFGSPRCLADQAYFQLQMDWVGFGSGANSLLQGEVLGTAHGKLAGYIASPLEHDHRIPAASPEVTGRLLYQALSTAEGASAALWKERTGADLDAILAQPGLQPMLDFFARTVGLERDARGLRIPAERLGSAFVQLLYWCAPVQARAVTSAPKAASV
jgi:oxygen-independent coproporphyrinogen-3 oxidase